MTSALGMVRSLLAARQGSHLTDEVLLERFVATREEAAFAALVERHGPLVLGVCRSVLRHAQDAEDAFQATFLVLARKAASIRKPASLAPWLHGVAFRLATRARADREQVCERQVNDHSPPTPLDELTGRELRHILHEELARLPESYRLPLILCYLKGQTQDEAARQLGWTAATLKGRVDRGRNLLRRRLSRRGVALGLPLFVGCLAEGARAALPAPVAARIARAAVGHLAGGAAAGEIGRTAVLAESGEAALGMLRLKAGAALVLTVAILGTGLAAFQVRKADAPEPRQEESKRAATEREQERTDEHGDPLPQGALLRFGSARLRHGSVIYASALSPDGTKLATAGAHSVILWDLDRGKILRRLPCDEGNTFCCPGLAFSPDGTCLAYVRGNFFACVWDVRTGKELRRFARHYKDGLARFWEGSGRLSHRSKEVVLISRGAIETWDVESGQRTASLPVEGVSALSPDGRFYLRHEGNDALVLGDARTGKVLSRLKVAAHQDGIENGMAFSPDGKTLALVHNRKEIQLRETEGGKVVASFPLPESAQREITGSGGGYWEYRVAFSADGKTLLLGTSQGLIHRWDLATHKELPPLRKHHCAVAGMHTLADGRTLVSTGADGVIRRWDLRTGRHYAEPESYEGHSRAAYSADGRLVAVGDSRGRIDLWDGRTGKRGRTLEQEGAAVTHLAFAPDGKLLAAADRSGTVRFWEVPGGRPGAVWEHKPEKGKWFCNGIAFSPDSRLLCISDYPKQIRVMQVAGGKVLWKGKNAYGHAFSPDGATLLVAAPAGPHLTLLEAATGAKRTTVRLNTQLSDNVGVMYTLAFSADGHRLAVAHSGGGLMLCDGRSCAETHHLADGDLTRQEIIELRGGKRVNDIHALAFSPDGKWLAAAGSDRAVYLREAATGKEVLRLPGHEAEVSCVAFSPDGRRVFSYGQDGQGYLWDLEPKPGAGPRAGLKELWTDLAWADAGKAYRAVWALSKDPRAVDFLRKKLPPVAPPDRARVARLIADLDSDRFEVRDTAQRALAELAELAGPALEEAHRAAPSLEQRQRLDQLLASLKKGLSPSQVLQTRAVQALELASRADARQVLREWAGGAPAAHLTQEAQTALSRLHKPRP
jgi:RNA polymerase sigma factor (sigma-70 family)